ncbi:MAG: nuclease-related domain-containing protein [Methylococcales bacterium]
MIIKLADDKQSQLSAIKSLLSHPNADATKKKRIEQEIRNIQAGIRGEDEAAYEMKVHFGESKNWMIIHDLRIEHGGLVAQIDHLMINRFLEIWVCESKHFSEGIEINEHGEFSAFFSSKPYGVPSPIEQNNKHILILKRLFDTGIINLPTRLGLTMKPDLKSLVLVSKHARITRPKAKVDGLDCIIKNDHLFKTIDKSISNNNPLLLAKVIGQDTIEALAIEIINLHKPIQFDWLAKFGLSFPINSSQTPSSVTQQQNPAIQQNLQSISVEDAQKSNPKLICHTCGVSISYNVAKFCWSNKRKFGDYIYCMECQKKQMRNAIS